MTVKKNQKEVEALKDTDYATVVLSDAIQKLAESGDAQTIISITPDGHPREWQKEHGDRAIVINNLYLNDVFGYAPNHRLSVNQASYAFC